jgi:hypothetical protein
LCNPNELLAAATPCRAREAGVTDLLFSEQVCLYW